MRIQNQQSYFTKTAKGIFLGMKHKRREQKRKGRKKAYKAKPKIRRWQEEGTYCYLP